MQLSSYPEFTHCIFSESALLWADQVEEDEMDRTRSTNGEKRSAYMIRWESKKERDQ
jgi:hypothetical protein